MHLKRIELIFVKENPFFSLFSCYLKYCSAFFSPFFLMLEKDPFSLINNYYIRKPKNDNPNTSTQITVKNGMMGTRRKNIILALGNGRRYPMNYYQNCNNGKPIKYSW